MKLRTEINIEPFCRQIDYSNGGLAVGSCFAATMGERLKELKFNFEVNPTGVMFNPVSVADTLEMLADGREMSVEELTSDGEMWFSYRCHGSLADSNRQRALDNINRALERGHEALRRADHVILTLGTAWVYRLVDSAQVVANCHKMPANLFVRERMTVEQVVEALQGLVDGVLADKQVIITVSPVRHVSDGLSANSVSKAVLRVATELIAEGSSNVVYFPAYEIFNDDLRDYRFYADDLAHPSVMGAEYVWECFCKAAFSLATRADMESVGSVVRASRHRPLHPESPASHQFYKSMLAKARQLSERLGTVDLSEEIEIFMDKGEL